MAFGSVPGLWSSARLILFSCWLLVFSNMHDDWWIRWCLLPLNLFLGPIHSFAARNVLFIADVLLCPGTKLKNINRSPMTDKGLEYLLNFCKIKKGERVGDLEAVNFQVYGDGRQMEHLLIDCICHKCNRRSVESPFQIPASVLNWKITKYQKGGISTLDCGCS